LSIQRPEWPTGFGTQGQSYAAVYGPADGFYATGHNPTALVGNLAHTRVFVRVGDGVVYPYYPNELTNTFGAVAEADLFQHAQDFTQAAARAGVEVRYEPTTGIHDWPWWRSAFSSALQWGLFAPVAEAPQSWTFQTVSQSGTAWDLRFEFAAPPAAVERFSRRGDVLSATGSGTVTIRSSRWTTFTAALPFTRRLQPRPPARPHRRHVRRSRLRIRHWSHRAARKS
jgi:hypothetical protein